MIDRIKERLLRWLLPKQQFYIQVGGFHSHFRPVFHSIAKEHKPYDSQDDNPNYNGSESVH